MPVRPGVGPCRRAVWSIVGVIVLCPTTGGCTSDPVLRGDWRLPAEVNGALLRAFSPDSWWNLPVVAHTRSHKRSTTRLCVGSDTRADMHKLSARQEQKSRE